MLAVLFASAFIAAFNENVVNVALVDIMSEFSVTSVTAQWMVTGYMIVTSIVVTIMAFLLRRFSLRTLYFIASACFIGGEIVDFVAPSFGLLIVARLVQAVGSGVYIPLMMTSVLMLAPVEQRGTYLSIGSAAITLGPAFAPVLSGVAVTFFGWRTVFLMPGAVALVLCLAGLRVLRNIGETAQVHIDVASLISLSVGLTLLVYGLGELTANLVVALACLVAACVALVLFGRRQFTLDEPLLNLTPLLNPLFSISCVLSIVAMMTTFSMSVLLPLYYEGGFAFTALLAGMLVLPAIVVNALTAIAGGRVMDKRGPWPLLPLGFGLIVVGQCVAAAFGGTLNLAVVVAASVATYAGVGLIMAPSQTAGLSALDGPDHPHGVSILNAFVMIAASIGPSLFIGVLSSGESAAAQAGVSAASALASGFSQALVVAAVIAIAGFAIATVYAWRLRRQSGEGLTPKR
ncbi:MAG: MFS transporter [Eggerthellaceae bacterium]|nr:MFS transporter [Eggerthellaceae bacterium]